MRAFDALRILPMLSGAGNASSLLFDVTLEERPDVAVRQRSSLGGVMGQMSLSSMADRLSIPAVERFEDDQLVMEPMRLRELVGMIDQVHLRTVCVDGPIEARDAEAMRRAVAAGLSPLQAEFRASASIEVTADAAVSIESREKKPALRMAAECVRLFLGAMRSQPAEELALPELWQIERLLEETGAISLRPIETEAYSTFLDIGVSTALEPFSKPANRSLIYDVPSNSWHDEA